MIKLRPLMVSFLALLSKDSIILVILLFTDWSFSLAPDRRSCGRIVLPRKVKLSENFSMLRPETELKRLKRSRMLVMLVLSL